MTLQKGLGKGFAVPLIAAAMVASGASAAMVSFSSVFTNNTLADKVYDIRSALSLTSPLGNTAGSGTLAIVVSDIRGGGAYVKSVGLTALYTSFVKGVKVAEMGSAFNLSASAFSQNSYTDSFNKTSYGVSATTNDEIDKKFRVILSAGDQAVVSGTFVVVSAVPAPGAIGLVGIAGGFAVRGRRRENL